MLLTSVSPDGVAASHSCSLTSELCIEVTAASDSNKMEMLQFTINNRRSVAELTHRELRGRAWRRTVPLSRLRDNFIASVVTSVTLRRKSEEYSMQSAALAVTVKSQWSTQPVRAPFVLCYQNCKCPTDIFICQQRYFRSTCTR